MGLGTLLAVVAPHECKPALHAALLADALGRSAAGALGVARGVDGNTMCAALAVTIDPVLEATRAEATAAALALLISVDCLPTVWAHGTLRALTVLPCTVVAHWAEEVPRLAVSEIPRLV